MSSEFSDRELKVESMQKLRTSEDPMERLRLQCLTRGASGIKGLGRMFRIIDDDGSRRIEFSEFVKGIHDYGLDLPQDEVTALFHTLDTDGSGSIDYNEFLIAVRPPMSKGRITMIEKAFQKLDKTGDGQVTIDDLQGVYDVKKNPKYMSGELSKEDIFKNFLKSFESKDHVDGIVTKEEFLNYYAGVSASIDKDIYFDLMMRNAWNI